MSSIASAALSEEIKISCSGTWSSSASDRGKQTVIYTFFISDGIVEKIVDAGAYGGKEAVITENYIFLWKTDRNEENRNKPDLAISRTSGALGYWEDGLQETIKVYPAGGDVWVLTYDVKCSPYEKKF